MNISIFPKTIMRAISCIVLTAFVLTSVVPPSFAQVAPWMPEPGTMVLTSPVFTPAHLRGMVVDPNAPFKFDFIMHKGNEVLSDENKQKEYQKLIKYFLASLAVPDSEKWVNLSPYEKDRIIPDSFGLTEMGRDLLAQDYLLKQIASSLSNPEEALGKRFWDEVYGKAQETFGTVDIPASTINKVWILPDKADIYEKDNTVVIVESHLKVMLEEDYLALEQSAISDPSSVPQADEMGKLTSRVMREIIIPAIEKEVNEGKNFAPLRQIVSGMILAAWYRMRLKETILAKVYADKGKVKGIDQDPKANQEIYTQYVDAFQKGVFNMIKEDVDVLTQEIIPRKYFSGGFETAMLQEAIRSLPLGPTVLAFLLPFLGNAGESERVQGEWANSADSGVVDTQVNYVGMARTLEKIIGPTGRVEVKYKGSQPSDEDITDYILFTAGIFEDNLQYQQYRYAASANIMNRISTREIKQLPDGSYSQVFIVRVEAAMKMPDVKIADKVSEILFARGEAKTSQYLKAQAIREIVQDMPGSLPNESKEIIAALAYNAYANALTIGSERIALGDLKAEERQGAAMGVDVAGSQEIDFTKQPTRITSGVDIFNFAGNDLRAKAALPQYGFELDNATLRDVLKRVAIAAGRGRTPFDYADDANGWQNVLRTFTSAYVAGVQANANRPRAELIESAIKEVEQRIGADGKRAAEVLRGYRQYLAKASQSNQFQLSLSGAAEAAMTRIEGQLLDMGIVVKERRPGQMSIEIQLEPEDRGRMSASDVARRVEDVFGWAYGDVSVEEGSFEVSAGKAKAVVNLRLDTGDALLAQWQKGSLEQRTTIAARAFKLYASSGTLPDDVWAEIQKNGVEFAPELRNDPDFRRIIEVIAAALALRTQEAWVNMRGASADGKQRMFSEYVASRYQGANAASASEIERILFRADGDRAPVLTVGEEGIRWALDTNTEAAMVGRNHFAAFDGVKADRAEFLRDAAGLKAMIKDENTRVQIIMKMYESDLRLVKAAQDSQKETVALDPASQGELFKVVDLEGRDVEAFQNILVDVGDIKGLVALLAQNYAALKKMPQWLEALGLYLGDLLDARGTVVGDVVDAQNGTWLGSQQPVEGNKIYPVRVRAVTTLVSLPKSGTLEDRVRQELAKGTVNMLFPAEFAMAAPVQAEAEKAMTSYGGIDLNAANLDMQIKRDGGGMVLPIADQNLDNIRIDGLVPVILSIQPASTLPLFSQLQQAGSGASA